MESFKDNSMGLYEVNQNALWVYSSFIFTDYVPKCAFETFIYPMKQRAMDVESFKMFLSMLRGFHTHGSAGKACLDLVMLESGIIGTRSISAGVDGP